MSNTMQIRVSDSSDFVTFGGLPDGALVRKLDIAIGNITGDALFGVYGHTSRPRSVSAARNGDPVFRPNDFTLDGSATEVLARVFQVNINKIVRPNWRFLSVVLDTEASDGDCSMIISLDYVPKQAKEFLG